MRALRYSINVTSTAAAITRVIPADEELHRHLATELERADALLFCRVTYEKDGSSVAAAGDGSVAWLGD